MFKSLRSKLVVFFVLVTLIPMSIVGFIGYTSQKQELSTQLEDSMISQTANLSAELLNLINERLMDVEMLTRSPVMRSPDSPFLSIREELYNFLSVNNIYYDAIILNHDGTVLMDTENEMTGRNLGDREWFQEVSESGLKQMSDIYYSDAIERPVLVLGAPVYTHDHELLYYVSPSFDLDVFYERIDDYTTQQRTGGSDGYAFLLREDGVVLSHPDQERVMNVNYFEELGVNKDGLNDAIHPSGTTLQVNGEVHAFSRTDEMQGFPHRWYVGIAMNEDDLYSSLDHLLLRYVGFFFLVFVILIVSVMKLSDYLVKPIRELVERTKAYAEGDEVRQKTNEAYREADHLHQAFDDMTERIRKREDSHKKSTQVLAATDNGVFAADTESRTLTLANLQFKRLFGFEGTSVNGRTVDDLMAESVFFRHFCERVKLFRDESENRGLEKRQTEISCNDEFGEERIFFLSMTHLTSLNATEHSGKELLVVFQELTEKRRMERELIHSEKLGMVGQMAAGLAHEIRNPMTTIKGFMQLLEQRDNGKNKDHYRVVLNEIDRVNDIMNELMDIGSPEEVEEQELSETCVSGQMDELLILHEQDIKERHIEVETFYAEGNEPIVTNGHKLRQVLSNVIRNAIEAMPDGGRLILRAHRESTDRQEAIITISDTGLGMDEETVKKAGTPFFTTKDSGHGLGLATSYRIVKELGGSIDIDTSKGQGTSFQIRLPDLS